MTVKMIPYLVMNGNANEAIEFYQQALGATVAFKQTFGEMPENPGFPLSEEMKGRVSHATIQIGDDALMLSDTFPGTPHQTGNQVTICLTSDDKAQSEKYFQALQLGGHVSMPFQETFFSPGFAVLSDKFGVTWQIFTEGAHQ